MKTPTRYFDGMDYDCTIEAIRTQPHLAHGTISALQEENARLRKDYGALGMMALQRLNYDLHVEFREAVDEAVEVHLAQTQDTAKGGVK